MTILFQIESGEIKKQYIARVIGVFPEKEVPNNLLWATFALSFHSAMKIIHGFILISLQNIWITAGC